MAKTILFLLGFFLMAPMATQAHGGKGPELTLEKGGHDYGTVYVDELPQSSLHIKSLNTGDAPVVISSVRACCGTRVTSWPREPILPGEERTISVELRLPPRPHRISRMVTVTYNHPENPTVHYRIVGEVVARD